MPSRLSPLELHYRKADRIMLMVLSASASYIAAPAAIRAAIPQADVGLALLAALGISFPFNLLIGIPLYQSWITG